MTDEQTIAEIVRRVLERLNVRPAGASAPVATPKPTAPAPPPAAKPAGKPVRRQFVTADEVARRAASGRPVVLAANERLTPLGREYVLDNKVRLEEPPAPFGRGATAPAAAPVAKPIGVVVSEPKPETPSLLTALAREGVAVRRFTENNCWMRDGVAMMKQVAAGELAGGVFLAPAGGAAMVFANKFRGIRAVLGNGVDGVAEAVSGFDANVLVVEHARRSYHEARGMIHAFATLPRCACEDNALLAAIAKLEGRP